MTTEIEKQFFDTFGIDPRKTVTCVIEEDWLNDYHLKTHHPISDWMKYNAPCKGEKGCSDKCNCYQVDKSYPQITDHLLLELICELSGVCCPYFAFKRSISELKETVLKLCMAYKDLLKQQVRALFEEVKNDR